MPFIITKGINNKYGNNRNKGIDKSTVCAKLIPVCPIMIDIIKGIKGTNICHQPLKLKSCNRRWS